MNGKLNTKNHMQAWFESSPRWSHQASRNSCFPFACCVHAKQFSFLIFHRICSLASEVKIFAGLCESCRSTLKGFLRSFALLAYGGASGCSLDPRKKSENFLASKRFCIFIWAQRIRRTEKKLMWTKKKKRFFRSESANLTRIFSQSNVDFLPTFHFYTNFDHLINIFYATHLINDFTWTRNKRN